MKVKPFLALSVAALLAPAIASCSSTKATITTYKANSQFVVIGFSQDDDMFSCTLPTYHHTSFGDVPYVELAEFVRALSISGGGMFMPSTAKTERLEKGIYEISNHNITAYRFDANKDVLTIKREDSLEKGEINNNVGPDFTTPNDDPMSLVHTSVKSKYVVEPADIVLDLKPYNIDLVEQDERLYLPQQFVSSVVLKNVGADMIYNGLDYYASSYIGEDMTLFLAANGSYNSNKRQFSMLSRIFKEGKAIGDEVYRYIYEKPEGGYTFMSFKPDGTIESLEGEKIDDVGTPTASSNEFTYITEDDGIYVNFVLDFPGMGKQSLGVMKIPFEDTNFNTRVRSKAMANYSYNHLRFIFDGLYGLPDELFAKYNVKNTEELIKAKNLKDDLLSTDSVTYDHALATLTMTYVDDCHTKYIGCSVYSGFENKPAAINAEHVGERRAKLSEYVDEYKALRTEKMIEVDPKYADASLQQGLFYEGNTAVVRFDSFLTAGASLTRANPVDTDPDKISSLMLTSSPDGFYSAFKNIETHDEVKNVVIDLTANGGGAALTLPYLAAFFTDDPTFILKNSKTGAISEFHYNVDLNRNGIFNESADTYKGKYNIFLLTSGFSFSCGNALPTMARIAGTKIIGEQSGGGACAVTAYSDGCGSIFNTSNQYQISYKDPNGNYINNDAGIPVDYELGKESWYDLVALNQFVNSVVNNA